MKILTVSTSFPYPPDDGTKIQIYERIRILSERHVVTLLCVVNETISPERIKEMERYSTVICIQGSTSKEPATAAGKVYQLLRSAVLREPYYIHDQISIQAQSRLRRELSEATFDIIEGDGYANAYLRSIADTSRALKVAIFHSIGATCTKRELAVAPSLVQRESLRFYGGLKRSHDARVIRASDLCVTLTEDNRRDLQLLYPAARVRNCLSNGVDLEYFDYQAPTRPPTGVCFAGKMDYTPNVDAVTWFSRSVLPRIRQRLPQLEFVIVGSNPAKAVRALASDPRTTVTGYVNDIRPYVRQSGLMVLPMRTGGGILNKLLQSLAMGVPVVATSISLEGLAARPDRDLLVADSPDGLADGIVSLVCDAPLRLSLASAGRKYLEAEHQWASMVKRYEAELQRCLAERTSETTPTGMTNHVRTQP